MKLSAENLAFGAGGRVLARNLSFSLSPGEVLHVTGANGAGKSQLARVLLGYEPLVSGHLSLEHEGVRYLPQLQNRAAHLPFTLQEILLFNEAQPLLLPANRLSQAWNKASGGERQRALLSCFFSQAGDFLVMDEPFNHLDQAAKETVRELLRSVFARQPSAAALLISHDDHPKEWLRGVAVKELHLGGET